ncbi:MAG: fibronectin type III domain-containing protein, partial [Candidatus Cloacimonetes bacterium]|nr:fibronectin type III domain-containing protein [Candidatus Cloacimonadota bacterium]
MLNKMKSHLFVGKTILSYLVSLSFILGAVNLGAVRKAPYLIYREYEDEDDNEVQCREMQILCQLEGEDDCKIQWRTGEEFYNNYVDMESSETGHQYFYTIENLTPGKLYYYKVTIGREEPKVYESSFRANPATDATTAKFFVYGDTRLYPEVHDEVAADIIANYADNPTWQTCVISVGDLVNNGGNENNWDGEFFDPSYPNIQEMLATMP